MRFAAFGALAADDPGRRGRRGATTSSPPSAWPRSRRRSSAGSRPLERPARVIAFPQLPPGRHRDPSHGPPLDRRRRGRRADRRARSRPGARLPADRRLAGRSVQVERRAEAPGRARGAVAVPALAVLNDDDALLDGARGLRDAAGTKRSSALDDHHAAGRATSSSPDKLVATSQPLIFRKGLDMKEAVAGELADAYDSAHRRPGPRATTTATSPGRLTRPPRARVRLLLRRRPRGRLRLPGARSASPDRSVFLTGEIIHNPHVNDRLRAAGHPLPHRSGRDAGDTLGADDVVILPAFGVTVGDMAQLVEPGLHARRHDLRLGAQRLEERRPLRAGRLHRRSSTARCKHEETRATASQALEVSATAAISSSSIARKRRSSATTSGTAGDRAAFLARFARRRLARASIPTRDLDRVGCANQTTMLMTESLEIGEMFGAAMRDRYGDGRDWPRTSARSTRSAAPRRSGRTRSSRCSTSSRST